MTLTVDTSKPIEVVDFLGRTEPATYVRHQEMHPERYEIVWRGRKWTVSADNRLQGLTDSLLAVIDPAYRVRNRVA
jgi:hypothetical protein